MKAMRSQADAISFDLEDAVLPDRKSYAREQLIDFLGTDDYKAVKESSKKIVIVRINPLDSTYAMSDLQAVCRDGVDIVNIPKINSSVDVHDAVQCIKKERDRNGCHSEIKILANIETPTALQNAAEIGAAHPGVWGLQLGLGDMFEPFNIDRNNHLNLHAILFTLRMAAATSGAIVYDGAYTNVGNPEGFRAEALTSKCLGYLGKTCIHPSQVAIANEVFQPSSQEIDWALKVIQATRANHLNGAFLLDGKMIDAPFVLRAETIVNTAERLGLLGR
jgi:citrate lyase subunit beta/citryl-CoA lyase